MKYNNIVPYAMDFASFLLSQLNPKDADKIKNIILFGSSARGEQHKKSDIDIFIETTDDHKGIEDTVENIPDKFYGSIRYKSYWKLKGYKQLFSIKVGNREEWDNLYPSLLSDGIVLYGKYSTELKGKNEVLFSWENVSDLNARVTLYRTLYGYNKKSKKYPGFLKEHNGERITKGCILVPLESRQNIKDLFKKLKIPVKEFLVNVI
jgi:predicted nucleotidyltransferase